MSELTVTIVLPSGGARVAEIPDDVPVRELMAELTSTVKTANRWSGWTTDGLPSG